MNYIKLAAIPQFHRNIPPNAISCQNEPCTKESEEDCQTLRYSSFHVFL